MDILVVKFVCGKEQKKKIEKTSMPNNTVRRRISVMSRNILDQVAEEIGASKARIILQLDESTDVSNCPYLLANCRYVHFWKLKEEFLMCESLETTTKVENTKDIVEKINNFLGKIISHRIIWALSTQTVPLLC